MITETLSCTYQRIDLPSASLKRRSIKIRGLANISKEQMIIFGHASNRCVQSKVKESYKRNKTKLNKTKLN